MKQRASSATSCVETKQEFDEELIKITTESYKIITAVVKKSFELQQISPHGLTIMLYLVKHLNHTNFTRCVFPKIKKIAEELNLSPSTIKRHVELLRVEGLIVRVRSKSNLYYFTPKFCDLTGVEFVKYSDKKNLQNNKGSNRPLQRGQNDPFLIEEQYKVNSIKNNCFSEKNKSKNGSENEQKKKQTNQDLSDKKVLKSEESNKMENSPPKYNENYRKKHIQQNPCLIKYEKAVLYMDNNKFFLLHNVKSDAKRIQIAEQVESERIAPCNNYQKYEKPVYGEIKTSDLERLALLYQDNSGSGAVARVLKNKYITEAQKHGYTEQDLKNYSPQTAI